MSDTVLAHSLIKEAFPESIYGNRKSALYAARRFLNKHTIKDITERRVRSLWENTARRVDGEELDALRKAQLRKLVHEQKQLRTRLDTLDQVLATINADEANQALSNGRQQPLEMG